VGLHRVRDRTDMWVCTGSGIGQICGSARVRDRKQRSSPDVPLEVSLGKCEISLNGGTEYDGFEKTC